MIGFPPIGPERLAYGKGPSQFGLLRLPGDVVTAPVVVLIHGGCWVKEHGDLTLMEPLAADLVSHGYAVWNLEYRGVDEPGGGYPGTFADTANGLDHLRDLGSRFPVDLDRVAIIGHSAGGHLALWAAARRRLPPESGLAGSDPLSITGVVTLAGLNDLAAYHDHGPGPGATGVIDTLVGPSRPRRFADTSPAELLPIGATQLVVSGDADELVPPEFGEAYVERARAAGDRATALVFPGADHFTLINPASDAWQQVCAQLPALL